MAHLYCVVLICPYLLSFTRLEVSFVFAHYDRVESRRRTTEVDWMFDMPHSSWCDVGVLTLLRLTLLDVRTNAKALPCFRPPRSFRASRAALVSRALIVHRLVRLFETVLN